MGVSEQFPARLLSKPISSTFFSPSSRGRLVVALVFRVLLVAGLQDDRQPEGPAQDDGVPPAPAHDEPPRVGPRAARPGPAPRQRRAVRLPRDDGAPEGRADRRRAAPAPRPRRLAQTHQHGAQGQRRDAAPVRGGAGAAGRRPGQVVGARRQRPRRTVSRRRASAACTPRSGASPSSAFAAAAPARLSITTKAKSRRHLLFLIYALLATTTMLFSKEQPDLRTRGYVEPPENEGRVLSEALWGQKASAAGPAVGLADVSSPGASFFWPVGVSDGVLTQERLKGQLCFTTAAHRFKFQGNRCSGVPRWILRVAGARRAAGAGGALLRPM